MYNILVCDDDKDIVEAIDIYLSKEGYNIIKAYDGMEADVYKRQVKACPFGAIKMEVKK